MMANNRQKLIDLMNDYQLTTWHVANILNVSKTTVRIWRCISPKNIPDHKLELLALKVKNI